MSATTGGPAAGVSKAGAYTVTRGHAGTEPVVTVSAPDDATRVTVALRGATLLSWQVDRLGTPFDLTDGYRDEAELRAQDGVRNGVLAPFPNRVADGRYAFAGARHDLLPGRSAPRLVYHGFARELPFALAEAVVQADTARLVLTSRIDPDRHPGYPFALDLDVTYQVTERAVEIEIGVTNTGRLPAPYAAGWHSYFRLPGVVDDWTLQIPAGTLVRTDDDLIPLDGADAYAPLDGLPAQDFRHPRDLAGRVIDACFTTLRAGTEQRAETILRHRRADDELRVWQHSGSLHVFTGDTLARDRRRSIALEPVETVTNAFNRADSALAITLDPGARRTFRFGAAYRPPRAQRSAGAQTRDRD
ncbi:MAG: aldose 1-epimerase [Actinocrinis sp.]